MNKEQINATAERIAELHGVPVPLLQRLIVTESGYNTYATRFEPNFRHFHRPRDGVVTTTWDTERILQKISWGLCQIMGCTARELGWEQPLPALVDASSNIDLACIYLVQLRRRAPGAPSWRWAITAYNHGPGWEQIQPEWWTQGYTAKFLDVLLDLEPA